MTPLIGVMTVVTFYALFCLGLGSCLPKAIKLEVLFLIGVSTFEAIRLSSLTSSLVDSDEVFGLSTYVCHDILIHASLVLWKWLWFPNSVRCSIRESITTLRIGTPDAV